MIFSLLSGLVAGTLHVLSGPDHLAAVAPLSLERRVRAWRVGFRWGLGHASGVLLVGLLAMLLRETIPVAWLSSWAERLVGVVLIGIGLWGFRRALTHRVHTHEHQHEGETHVHIHVHDHANAHGHAEENAHRHTHAAFAIGTLHGLAGSSHMLGVLPALAFPTAALSAAYLSAFGIGTVVAMAAFSSIVGLVAGGSERVGNRAYRAVMAGCSAAAVVIGGFWLVG